MEYALHIAQTLCLVGAEICHGYARPQRHYCGDILGRYQTAAGNADVRGRLVGKVDGLVRQEAVVYIPCGEIDRRRERSVGYLHAVVLFKALAHRAEHFQTVAARRLGYLHRLESALERCVLFDMAAVLLGRGRADYLHLAPAERRL